MNDYIVNQLELGTKIDIIRSNLAQAGWNSDDVDREIAEITETDFSTKVAKVVGLGLILFPVIMLLFGFIDHALFIPPSDQIEYSYELYSLYGIFTVPIGLILLIAGTLRGKKSLKTTH